MIDPVIDPLEPRSTAAPPHGSRAKTHPAKGASRGGRDLNVVFRFLRSYLLILIVPLVLASLVNSRFILLLEDDARQMNLSVLEQCRDTLDGRLAEIDSMIVSLSLNSSLIPLMVSTESIDRIIWKMAIAQRALYPYIATNSFLSDFFVYIRNSNTILSPFTTYIRLENVYGSIIRYGDLDYPEFRDGLLGVYHSKDYLPSVPVMLNGKTRNAVLCMQSIPLGLVSDVKANLMFFIDEDRFRDLLSRLRIENGGWAYIADGNDRVLVSIERDRGGIGPDEIETAKKKKVTESTYSGKKMIISCTVSSSNGWTYVAASPYKVVMARVEAVRRLSIFVVSSMVFLGFATALILAFFNSRSVRKVIALLKGELGGCEYANLEDSILELISRNESMSRATHEQLPILRSVFLDRLLRGEFVDAREAEASAAQADLCIKGTFYAVLLLRISGYYGSATREILEELRIKKMIVHEVLVTYFVEPLWLHDVSAANVSVLVCFGDSEDGKGAALAGEMGQAVRFLEERHGIKASFGAGRLYPDLLDATRSFYEASEALDRGSESRVVLYSDGLRPSGGYSYPIDREMRLINLVKAGDGACTRDLLDTIQKEDPSSNGPSRGMDTILLNQLRGTLMRILSQVEIGDGERSRGIADRIAAFKHGDDIGSSYESYVELFLGICDAINEQKKSHNSMMLSKMTERIHERFMDSDFGLSVIADEFEVTEVYASQFFKEQAGENFSTYLERTRMGRARELLETTDITINELAAEVGYNSAHAFRRAYKRVNGVVPTVLRNTR